MNAAARNGHVIELRDESNRLVGYYVPVPVHEEAQGEVTRLQVEIAALRRDLDDIRADRDRFRQTTYDLMREFLPLGDWDQEALDVEHTVPFAHLVALAGERVKGN